MYEKFQSLNGEHPWREVAPDAYIDYRARYRAGGRVIYFNYALGSELELIPANHARRMVKELEKAILETFSLQIINEYDEEHGGDFRASSVRPHTYMATRYLQAQHKDKRGLTSGDGRAIWNGQIKTSRMVYDVSSRGTGATRLSPGAQIADGPVKTGDDSWGYSCGRADLDEMLATALMSEIFHQNGFPTERTLAVIEYGDGTAVGVRAAPNLIRPAHMFRYLKQGKHAELKASFDYFLARQVASGGWKLPAAAKQRYGTALQYIANSYAKLAAILEEEYIFNWLAWDGDNMLANGAILDYGSIRQFAAKHDKYRYDDVDRFSSSLTEQKYWARELVKAFAQAANFIKSGEKRTLSQFKNAKCLREFDKTLARERDRRMLWRVGFEPKQIARLLNRAKPEISDFRRAMEFFEDAKVARGMSKVSDGVTHSPLYLVRNILRRLPGYYADECASKPGALMNAEEFCSTMAASYASRRDSRMTASRIARTRNFQKCYQRLAAAAGPYESVIKTLRQRAEIINDPHRMTGNAVIHIVNEVVSMKDEMKRDELQAAMDRFIESQVLLPERCKPIAAEEMEGSGAKARLLRAMQKDLEACKETI
jgi:uncharacterized protein YdiU (UPF0061 family)